MNRRQYLLAGSLALTGTVTGCTSLLEQQTAPPGPELLIFVTNHTETDTGWNVSIEARLESWAPIHDSVLLAYDATGNQVCRQPVGDLGTDDNPYVKTITTTCDVFPTIITATAKETPCDGAEIEILYWVGDERYKHEDPPDETILWEAVTRKCDEPLPPERVLRNVRDGTTTTGP